MCIRIIRIEEACTESHVHEEVLRTGNRLLLVVFVSIVGVVLVSPIKQIQAQVSDSGRMMDLG